MPDFLAFHFFFYVLQGDVRIYRNRYNVFSYEFRYLHSPVCEVTPLSHSVLKQKERKQVRYPKGIIANKSSRAKEELNSNFELRFLDDLVVFKSRFNEIWLCTRKGGVILFGVFFYYIFYRFCSWLGRVNFYRFLKIMEGFRRVFPVLQIYQPNIIISNIIVRV